MCPFPYILIVFFTICALTKLCNLNIQQYNEHFHSQIYILTPFVERTTKTSRSIPFLLTSTRQSLVLEVKVSLRHTNTTYILQKKVLRIKSRYAHSPQTHNLRGLWKSCFYFVLFFTVHSWLCWFKTVWRNVAMPPYDCRVGSETEGGHCGWQEARCQTQTILVIIKLKQ